MDADKTVIPVSTARQSHKKRSASIRGQSARIRESFLVRCRWPAGLSLKTAWTRTDADFGGPARRQRSRDDDDAIHADEPAATVAMPSTARSSLPCPSV